MPREGIQLQKLHVRLLKPSIRTFEEALEEPESLQGFDLKAGLPFEGRLYLAEPITGTPPWLEFVQTGVAASIGRLTNRTNAAVLLIRCSRRMFAISFGFGRHRLRESELVPDFGLRTALNSVEHSSLRALDSLTIEDHTRHTRAQVSRASSLHAFGLDVGRDILRAVTGTPRSDVRLHSVSGSEATLAATVRSDFPGLASTCNDLLRLYREGTYRKHFAWVDNVSRVRDPSMIAALDLALLDDLTSSSRPRAYLAPPEPVEWEIIQGFNYTHSRVLPQPDMALDTYLRGVNIPDFTLQDLQSHRVFVYGLNDQSPIDQWPVYKCLVFETSREANAYVLTSGTWYEIDRDFAHKIRRALSAIPPSDLRLPPAHSFQAAAQESEANYNARVVGTEPTLALMDKKLASCASAGTSIEFCDLFSTSRHIVHVKHRKGGSSTLSHLFAQARVSAEALLSDTEFRSEVRDHLSDAGSRWARLVPIDRPDASRYQVVIAIIGQPQARAGSSLPFFSQLNLVRTYESLTALGFRVGLLGIPVAR